MDNSATVVDAVFNVVEARSDLEIERRMVEHACGVYGVVRVASKDLARPIVVVAAGFHGDEIAGPVTIARHLGKIVDEAHARGLGVIVYPLVNPSGFDRRTRYSGDGDRGDGGNNDIVRYVLDDGALVGEVPADGRARPIRFADDAGARLPAETRALIAWLKRDPVERVVAAIDLHQDCITDAGPAAYAYAFGDLSRYAPIVAAVRGYVPLLAHRAIDAGFESTSTSDADGFIVRHDGSFSDFFWRRGARDSIAVETSGATPLDVAVDVNLAWILGVIRRHSG